MQEEYNAEIRKLFIDELIYIREIDRYEVEYLYEEAKRGEAEMMIALRCVFGTERNRAIRETAHGCCGHAEFILDLMRMEGKNCSEQERRFNLIGIEECLHACEYAMELARRYAPEECGVVAMCVERCRRANRRNRIKLLV